MSISELNTERRGQSLIVTFNRPQFGNAMTLDMANALHTVLKNATTDRSVRAVMLRGAGGIFMDGRNIAAHVGNLDQALDWANQMILPYHSAIREMQVMDKPVLAVVEGHVTGAGMSLMLASDLVMAARSTRFNCKFTEHAMTPDGGCSWFLPRKVGLARAMELMMLSEEFDAARADRLRLVNHVVEDDKLAEESLAWLDRLAAGPTRAFGAVKKLATQSFEQDLGTHLGVEHSYFGQSSRSFDFREAVKAHKEGRAPRFTGT